MKRITQKQALKIAKRAGHFLHEVTPYDAAMLALKAFEEKRDRAGVNVLYPKSWAQLPTKPSLIMSLQEEHDLVKFSTYNFDTYKIKTTLALCAQVWMDLEKLPVKGWRFYFEQNNGKLFEYVREEPARYVPAPITFPKEFRPVPPVMRSKGTRLTGSELREAGLFDYRYSQFEK